MDRIVELSRLYDFYGSLLTERQQTLVQEYANENLTLSEISEIEQISRAGVRDSIIHAEHNLKEFEEKLHIVRNTDKIQEASSNIRQLLVKADVSGETFRKINDILVQLESLWEDDNGV